MHGKKNGIEKDMIFKKILKGSNRRITRTHPAVAAGRLLQRDVWRMLGCAVGGKNRKKYWLNGKNGWKINQNHKDMRGVGAR